MTRQVTKDQLIKVVEVLLVNAGGEDSEINLAADLAGLDRCKEYFDDALEQLIFVYNVVDYLPDNAGIIFFKLSKLRKLHASLTADIYGVGNDIVKVGKYIIDVDNGWFVYEEQNGVKTVTIPTGSQPIKFFLMVARAGGHIVEYKQLAKDLDINGYDEEQDNDYHAEIVKFNKTELKKLLIKILPLKIVTEIQSLIRPVRHRGYRLAT